MSNLKRTQLYDLHTAAGATMVDFGGWEMPMKYPTDIVAEHAEAEAHIIQQDAFWWRGLKPFLFSSMSFPVM